MSDIIDFITGLVPPKGYDLGHVWPYRDAAGVVIGAVARYDLRVADTNKKSKQYRPFVTGNGVGPIVGAFPAPRPLYGLDQLAARSDAPVLVVEGEKCADAASRLFSDHVVVTSPSGSNAAGMADWSVLSGRAVTVWPDNDTAGLKYAVDVLERIPNTSRIVVVPESFPEGWDLADTVPHGADLQVLFSRAARIAPEKLQEARKGKKGCASLRRSAAEAAAAERVAIIRKVRALQAKTVERGSPEEEAKEAAKKAEELIDKYGIDPMEIEEDVGDVEPDDDTDPVVGHELLDSIEAFLKRFVSYPSEHAVVAHVLWIVHAHLMDCWITTPRLHFCSAEKMSGKTRALEITALLVPNSVLAVNVSPAYLCRKVGGDEANRPTILYDEIDNLFTL
jgi:hypothetical protein